MRELLLKDKEWDFYMNPASSELPLMSVGEIEELVRERKSINEKVKCKTLPSLNSVMIQTFGLEFDFTLRDASPIILVEISMKERRRQHNRQLCNSKPVSFQTQNDVLA